jgi:hypothetical protein
MEEDDDDNDDDVYRIYACYTNITLCMYVYIYIAFDYSRFHITAVGLETYYPRIRGHTCTATRFQQCAVMYNVTHSAHFCYHASIA